MNKLKTIGLTALGSVLIATSAFAAELAVTGGASISFDDPNRGKSARGNGFYMGDSIGFTGSGEMDNGMTVAVYYEIDGGNLDDHKLNIGMGDMGSLEFNGSGYTMALGAIDDVTPNAYEESWDIVAGADASNINGVSGASSFKYTSPTIAGATVSIGYLNASAAVDKSYTDWAIAYTPEMVEGLTIGYGQGDSEEVSGTTQDDKTMYIKYAVGPLTIGAQQSERDIVATGDTETDAYGITYAISDNISVGYNESTISKEGNSNEQKATGISASYTMGSMTLAGAMNEVDNVAFQAADDLKGYEFTLSFAF